MDVMEAVFKIQPHEFDENLFQQLKKIFTGRHVTIIISTEMDETSYLTCNPANERHLLESMACEPYIRFTPDEFERKVEELLGEKNPGEK